MYMGLYSSNNVKIKNMLMPGYISTMFYYGCQDKSKSSNMAVETVLQLQKSEFSAEFSPSTQFKIQERSRVQDGIFKAMFNLLMGLKMLE